MKNSKKSKEIQNKSQIIFFKNAPLEDETKDVFDFQIKAEAIEEAIKNGSNMIALIGDYGTGKSSLTKILYKRNIEKYAEPIYINLWDCLSSIDNKDDKTPVSYFTKSFLYQLALGNKSHNNFSRYINQRLSKNYGKLSFALAKKNTLWWILGFGITILLFFILKDNALPDSIGNLLLKENEELKDNATFKILKFISSIRYLLLFGSGICAYNSLKNNNILFSLWDSQGKIEPSDTDCFEVFEEIVTSILKNNKEHKQLIIIEDLDRSDNAPAVLCLLKELYRFNNLLSKKEQEQIVFIVSLKSENSLKDSSQEIGTDKQKAQQIYSKIFDYTVWVRPIHFANAKEIVLSLLGEQIGSEEAKKEINKLYWILQGDNLTVREIKDRLNETYLLYQSLSTRKNNSSVELKKCACVVYLQRQYPDEFQNLTKKETELSTLIEKITYAYGGDISKLDKKSDFNFIGTKTDKNDYSFSPNFIDNFTKILEEKNIESDYRMYFYNYPSDSYIMTSKEKLVYDYITFDKTSVSSESLNEAIKIAINDYSGTVIKMALSEIESAQTMYWTAVFQNDLLFKYASLYNEEYTLISFKEYFKNSMGKTAYADLCNILNNELFKENNNFYYKKQIVDWAVATILDEYKKQNKKEFINSARAFILKSIDEKDITLFTLLFNSPGVPIIDKELLPILKSPEPLFACLNFSLINEQNYQNYLDYITKIQFSSEYSQHLIDSIKKIQNLESIKDLQHILVKLFENNNIWDTELFTFIFNGYKESPKIIIDLIETTNLELLKDTDFIKLDSLHTNLIRKKELIVELEKHNCFTSALYSRIVINYFNDIDFSSENFMKELDEASPIIYSLQPDDFITLRKLLIQKCELTQEKIYTLFINNYPFVTESELDLILEPKDLYWIIDYSKVDDNYLILSEYCNKKQLKSTKLFNFFEALLLTDDSNKITNVNTMWSILENINFEEKQFNTIEDEEKHKLLSVLDEF